MVFNQPRVHTSDPKVPVDVTDYTARLVVVDANKQPVLVLTNGNGIVVGTTDGSFTCTFTNTDTNLLEGSLAFDLRVTSPAGFRTELGRGRINFGAPTEALTPASGIDGGNAGSMFTTDIDGGNA